VVFLNFMDSVGGVMMAAMREKDYEMVMEMTGSKLKCQEILDFRYGKSTYIEAARPSSA